MRGVTRVGREQEDPEDRPLNISLKVRGISTGHDGEPSTGDRRIVEFASKSNKKPESTPQQKDLTPVEHMVEDVPCYSSSEERH